jgi:hypothetical protein
MINYSEQPSWFVDATTNINRMCNVIHNTVKKRGLYRVSSEFVPLLISVIDKVESSDKMTNEMKSEVYRICESRFNVTINYCKKNNFLERDVDFIKDTLKNIEEKLIKD